MPFTGAVIGSTIQKQSQGGHKLILSGAAQLTVTPSQLVIAFIAPPWGDALNAITGLDPSRTPPPIIEIVDFLP